MNEGRGVDRLFTLGETRAHGREWMDYAEFGITASDIPALIETMVDPALNTSPDPLHHWTPLHAWRTLAQLQAVEAVVPLIDLHVELPDDDCLFADFPRVMQHMGPAAIAPLSQALARVEIDMFVRASFAEALAAIGKSDAGVQQQCASPIALQLAGFADHDPTFNGLLISALLELRADEHVGLIQQSMASGHVDESVAGDWEDVQVELGLLAARTTPRPRWRPDYMPEAGSANGDLALMDGMMPPPEGRAGVDGSDARRAQARAKQKAKRKLAKASRRRNRRR